jgi:thymidylate synthase (FAD)
MNVKLIAHTQMSEEFAESIHPIGPAVGVNERAAVALTAIRTCYSHLKPTEIVAKEGAKYFGAGGTEADRLFRHITRSGHTSTMEHITYTFAIEGVSRALLAQLTRHRHLSFSVQSQRYVRMGSADKSGGFDYVTPPTVAGNCAQYAYLDDFLENTYTSAEQTYAKFMERAQETYDSLRSMGVTPEDARMVLPQAASCNLVMSGNLRALLDFYAKRRPGNGAQAEIAELAEKIRAEIVKVDAWLEPHFDVEEGVK